MSIKILRPYLLIFSLIFVLNCEDKQSKKKSVENIEVVDDVERLPDTSETSKNVEPKSKKSKFPVLTEKNAMEFFLKYEKENKEDKVRITTDFGTIDIRLYDETKFHRANFIYLTKRKYFDETQFYRVVNNFVIQGGNTDDADVKRKRKYIGRYLLPKDTQHGFRHNRGVVSMPSSEIANPHKMASPYEFFIVQKSDGAYHLDGEYTAFGEVISGMDVVDEIAKQKTDKAEWPLHNVYIRKVEIID
ncbi:Peptidyl-prolyl cis-trans isomerase (rotamase)-cyclophilin family [Flavobacteriaceae bacterium MAR_2010_188]|nr:Peptidyl-prolyl cis-trans isomerase (rotamase)-cyclophilin family [Flavobacteriaceae bacterium MAR_2010_188]